MSIDERELEQEKRFAPNGQESHLSADDYDFVHSPEFKEHFGNWEEAWAFEKLRNSDPIEFDGSVYVNGEDISDEVKKMHELGLTKSLKALSKHLSAGVEKSCHNIDTGEDLQIESNDLHNFYLSNNELVIAPDKIKEIVENGILIEEEENENKEQNPSIEKYQCFATGLKVNNEDYTLKSVVIVDVNGNHICDFQSSEITKEGKDSIQYPKQQLLDENFEPKKEIIDQIRAEMTQEQTPEPVEKENRNNLQREVIDQIRAEVKEVINQVYAEIMQRQSPIEKGNETLDKSFEPQKEIPTEMTQEQIPESVETSEEQISEPVETPEEQTPESAEQKSEDLSIPVPPFALMTNHGFRNYDGYFLAKKNEMEKSVTLKKIDADGHEHNMTLTESTYSTILKNSASCKERQEQDVSLEKIQTLQDIISEPRVNTAYNFRHNFEVFCQKEANNPIDAIQIAKHIISEMPVEEQQKTQRLFKKLYASKNHDYTETLIGFYKEAVKDMPINLRKARADILAWSDMQTEKGTVISSDSVAKIGDEFKNVRIPIQDPLSGKTKYIKDDVKVYSATEGGNKVVLMNSRNELYSVARDDFLEAVNSKKERSQKRDTDLCIGR